MKFLAILAVFISTSVTVFGQIDGNEILFQNNIHYKSQSVVTTPDGIYIGVRVNEKKTLVYLYKEHSLVEVKSLKNFVIFAYSPSKNLLIVGIKPTNSKISDVTCTQIYSYDSTKTLIKLADYGRDGYSGIYNVSLKDNTLTCIVNTKRKNTVGSDLLPRTTILR
jgi:hypothetical protein